jgi:hypothetical protein
MEPVVFGFMIYVSDEIPLSTLRLEIGYRNLALGIWYLVFGYWNL